MNIKEKLQRKITIKQYELTFVIISVIFFVLFLITAWPRFRSDAMSIQWYWYLVLTVVFLVPVYKRILTR